MPKVGEKVLLGLVSHLSLEPEHQVPEHQVPEHQVPEHQVPEHQVPVTSST